jgi:hypothetical protein
MGNDVKELRERIQAEHDRLASMTDEEMLLTDMECYQATIQYAHRLGPTCNLSCYPLYRVPKWCKLSSTAGVW